VSSATRPVRIAPATPRDAGRTEIARSVAIGIETIAIEDATVVIEIKTIAFGHATGAIEITTIAIEDTAFATGLETIAIGDATVAVRVETMPFRNGSERPTAAIDPERGSSCSFAKPRRYLTICSTLPNAKSAQYTSFGSIEMPPGEV
jgi:hypothetical protein